MVTAPGSVLFGAAPSPQEANGTPLNGANGASTSGPAGAQNDPVAFDASTELTDYLHQAFVSADFSDVTLNVHYDPNLPELISTFNLHAIFLGRSPFLRNLLVQSYPQHPTTRLRFSITLPPARITPAALHLVLASLYTPSAIAHLSTFDAPSVLATAAFLGLDTLASHAVDLCERAIANAREPDDFDAWFAFLRAAGVRAGSKGSSPNLNGSGGGGGGGGEPFDGYAQRLLGALADRVPNLAKELGAFGGGGEAGGKVGGEAEVGGQGKLVDVLARLPFEVFKSALEGSQFPIANDMDRFSFAKRCITERRRRAGTTEFEETVVLQFGSQAPGATAVSVLRKIRRPQLWKASR